LKEQYTFHIAFKSFNAIGSLL